MRVLIADKFEKSGIDGLKALGCEVLFEPDLKDQALADAVSRTAAEVLIVRSTKVGAPAMGKSLRLIVRAGAGVNTIDVAAATAQRVIVANCPGKNSAAVAELAFGLMLALDRRIPDNVADLRNGKWNKKEYSNARGLSGRTLGLLGAGNIACEMIRRAAGFAMRVVLWSRRYDGQDRLLSDAEIDDLGVRPALAFTTVHLAPSPAALASRVDILSIHLALCPDTRDLINGAVLSKLAPGSFLINTARAECVDQAALRAAIRDRQLRVGVDVFVNEPASASGEFADTIVQEPGVYGTHHIGASTDQAQEAIAAETVRIVRTFKDTGRAPNAVNV
ncbi:MAG TPA: NAD(P)-dependent oxidoreductase [Vicinamibacterales bacterium]|nr:NAD(P)-dependent oxidoreductase [Vicinamibacterales bacterium]